MNGLGNSNLSGLLNQQFDVNGVEELPPTRDRSNTWHGPMQRKPKNMGQSSVLPDNIPETENGLKYSFPSSAMQGSLTNLQEGPGYSMAEIKSEFGAMEAKADTSSDLSASKKPSSRKNAWGPHSYADLITNAIQSSPDQRLTLSQIYDWMVQNVAYFRDKGDNNSSAGWKNSIRHNLSLHNRFMRVQNEGAGKSSWWVINPEAPKGNKTRSVAKSMDSSTKEAMKKKREMAMKKVTNNRLKKKSLTDVGVPPAGALSSSTSGGSPVSPAADLYLFNSTLSPEADFRTPSRSNPPSFAHRAAKTSPTATTFDQGQPSPYGSDTDGNAFLSGDHYGEMKKRFEQISVNEPMNEMPFIDMLEGPTDLTEEFDTVSHLPYEQPPMYSQQQQQQAGGPSAGGSMQLSSGPLSPFTQGGSQVPSMMQLTASQQQEPATNAVMFNRPQNNMMTQQSDPHMGYRGPAGQPFSSYNQGNVCPTTQHQMTMQASKAIGELAKRHQMEMGLPSMPQQTQQPGMEFAMSMGAPLPFSPQQTASLMSGMPGLQRNLSLNEIDLGSGERLSCDIEAVLQMESSLENNMDFQSALDSISS